MDTPKMPDAFVQADAFSLDGQRRVIRGTQLRLALTVVATVLLAAAPLWTTAIVGGEREQHNEHIEVLAIVAALLFMVAFVIELRLLRSRPETNWYDGRAVAESAKTLSWRYAVCGEPYPSGLVQAQDAFASDIKALGTDVVSLRSAVAGSVPTESMEALRSLPLMERQSVYLRERVRDQEEWYARKAEYNGRRAKQWSVVLLAAEALGVVLALLKGLSVVSVDLASVAAAVIASGTAWLAVKQHESIATAYALAANELGAVHVRLLSLDDEETWAREVASAEEAISREHTMWRASRANIRSSHDGSAHG